MTVIALQKAEDEPVSRTDLERIAVLEAKQEATDAQIARLVALEVTFARWAAAQEERNALKEREHLEGREDTRDLWAWVRWSVDRAIPLIALLLAAYVIVYLGNGDAP